MTGSFSTKALFRPHTNIRLHSALNTGVDAFNAQIKNILYVLCTPLFFVV